MLEYQLLSPEEDIEEIFPYRRVWRALTLEMVVFLALIIGIIIATTLGIIEDRYQEPLSVFLTLAPFGIFYLISVRGEQRVTQPRERLVLILVMSAVVANGVAWPVIRFAFTPERWLVDSGFFTRIIGYTLTLGVLAEILKYLVLRYTVWPRRFRIRLDGIAYSVPAALGYAFIVNIQFILTEEPILSAAAVRILTNVFLHIMVGAMIGYFLGELTFGEAPFFWMPMGLGIAAFISGIFVAFRQVSTVSGLGSRALGSLFLVVGFAVFILGVIAFLTESADRQMQERTGGQRIR